MRTPSTVSDRIRYGILTYLPGGGNRAQPGDILGLDHHPCAGIEVDHAQGVGGRGPVEGHISELTEEQLERAIPARLRRRLMQGRLESGEDIAAPRRFVGLTQAEFARAIAISVHTVRNGEQGRRKPEGPSSRSCASPRGIRGSFVRTWRLRRDPGPSPGGLRAGPEECCRANAQVEPSAVAATSCTEVVSRVGY
jgi:DNA-binding transcriptional regulator YiaG